MSRDVLDLAPLMAGEQRHRIARGGYEEYHPYGSTAWWAGSGATVSQKRYRYTGMEKDEETGLSYHHHRYYATWLGRWTSSDPAAFSAGINRYAFVMGNPVKCRDPHGLADPAANPAAEPQATPRPVGDVYRDVGLRTMDKVAAIPDTRLPTEQGMVEGMFGMWFKAMVLDPIDFVEDPSGHLARGGQTFLRIASLTTVEGWKFHMNTAWRATDVATYSAAVDDASTATLNIAANTLVEGALLADSLRFGGAVSSGGGGSARLSMVGVGAGGGTLSLGASGAAVGGLSLRYDLGIAFSRGLTWQALGNGPEVGAMGGRSAKHRREAGMYPYVSDHHWFAKEHAPFWSKHGIQDVDEFTLTMPEWDHQALHRVGTPETLMGRLEARAKELGKTALTREETLEVANKQMRELGYDPQDLHWYRQ